MALYAASLCCSSCRISALVEAMLFCSQGSWVRSNKQSATQGRHCWSSTPSSAELQSTETGVHTLISLLAEVPSARYLSRKPQSRPQNPEWFNDRMILAEKIYDKSRRKIAITQVFVGSHVLVYFPCSASQISHQKHVCLDCMS